MIIVYKYLYLMIYLTYAIYFFNTNFEKKIFLDGYLYFYRYIFPKCDVSRFEKGTNNAMIVWSDKEFHY